MLFIRISDKNKTFLIIWNGLGHLKTGGQQFQSCPPFFGGISRRSIDKQQKNVLNHSRYVLPGKETFFMKKSWRNGKVAYQIYPKSFCDSNGDGIGDLRGVLSKLDYLKDLGVDIIWLSPVYQSPFVDQGYDISDYYRIAEEFGTMEDFDLLLAEAKRLFMFSVMDLVVHHFSYHPEWFQ